MYQDQELKIIEGVEPVLFFKTERGYVEFYHEYCEAVREKMDENGRIRALSELESRFRMVD